jgi:uncharacterized protein YjbJ (UPF0337 family)
VSTETFLFSRNNSWIEIRTWNILATYGVHAAFPFSQEKVISMDKDRIEGSAKQAKGAIKEVAGKVTGDAKLRADGKADKTAGRIQNAIGRVKDALRGK